MNDKATPTESRITAIDQLRGYAIFGMLLVNANELFSIEVDQFEHHRETFSYADTIAPLFLFVVGIGMRLSWLRRSERVGETATRKAMLKRFTTLVLIAFALYAGWLWDALMDIGLAGLLAILLIDKAPKIRAAAAFLMVAVYQAIVTFTIYGPWITRAVDLNDENMPLLIRLIPLHGELFDVRINGGPLGPLSWCMMLLFGSLAYDLIAQGDRKKLVTNCLAWGAVLCALGYALHLPWGDAKAAWPISAYYMTAPFPLWATGLCFFHLLGFYFLCDKFRIRIPTFTSMGMNALFIYILQSLALDVIGGFDTPEVPLRIGILGFALFYGCFALLAWWMYRRQIFVKI